MVGHNLLQHSSLMNLAITDNKLVLKNGLIGVESSCCCGTCDTRAAASGGAGVTENEYVFPESEQVIKFSWDAFGIPDSFTVKACGETKVETGPVSGFGSQCFLKPEGCSLVTVRVVGPVGTLWVYNIACGCACEPPCPDGQCLQCSNGQCVTYCSEGSACCDGECCQNGNCCSGECLQDCAEGGSGPCVCDSVCCGDGKFCCGGICGDDPCCEGDCECSRMLYYDGASVTFIEHTAPVSNFDRYDLTRNWQNEGQNFYYYDWTDGGDEYVPKRSVVLSLFCAPRWRVEVVAECLDLTGQFAMLAGRKTWEACFNCDSLGRPSGSPNFVELKSESGVCDIEFPEFSISYPP